MLKRYQILQDADIDHFLQRGFVRVSECFTRAFAQEKIEHAFKRLGYDPSDPETWNRASAFLPNESFFHMEEAAPKAFAAACDLVGGTDRISSPVWMGDGFNINFRLRADTEWQPPSPESPGWHKDGDFFRSFLDSPEQGLIALVYWTDTPAKGGGTFLACDSVAPVARYLAAHPEGVVLDDYNFGDLIHHCQDFEALTAQAGDVVFAHPLMLHASSSNVSGKPRFLTNPPISLKTPLCLNRADPAEYSPIEQVILNALGVSNLDFQIAGVRERVTPLRIQRQKEMLAEEQARSKSS